MRLPRGFRAAGSSVGLKASGRPDLGAVVVDRPAAWAFTGTLNAVRAPCVERNRELFESADPVRALVVNSGHANCATGAEGARDNERYAGLAASALGPFDPNALITASTGVVGQRIPMETLSTGLLGLPEGLSEDVDGFARAILTTDTITKKVSATLPGGGTIVGVAKGSGMIHPNMATMLAFVFTDVAAGGDDLRWQWRAIVDRSFNQLTVDGDTSPNDMAMVLSSGYVQEEWDDFSAGLLAVTRRLARMIARDGEGATRLLTVEVSGAANGEEARAAARTVAGSPLVKAAVHGNDPNWGRILVAAGRSGAQFDPARVSISLQGTEVFRGEPLRFDAAALSRALAADEVVIAADLGAGSAVGEAWGCDLSAEYVRINADYTT